MFKPSLLAVRLLTKKMYIWAGLCGTFDVNPDNDFRMRDGSIEPDVNIFAEDWEDLWCRGNDGGV